MAEQKKKAPRKPAKDYSSDVEKEITALNQECGCTFFASGNNRSMTIKGFGDDGGFVNVSEPMPAKQALVWLHGFSHGYGKAKAANAARAMPSS